VNAQPNAPQVLNRAVFVTSRELEYFTAKELTLQTGHEPERWPEVILKELVDNGLDACEGAGIAPEIIITLTADAITVTDNGPGLPAAVIKSYLHDLTSGGDVDSTTVGALLSVMRAESKPIKPQALGVIGQERLRAWFAAREIELATFEYRRTADVDANGLPFVCEIAFAWRSDRGQRQLVTGINWSPTLVDPFRSLSRYGIGLADLLSSLHADPDCPITFALHLACPHLNYTDRGKSSLEVL